MAKRNSINADFTVNADGFDLAAGTTPRKFTLTGGDVAVAGSGSDVYTFPGATTTLVGHDTTQTLSNKTLAAPIITGAVTFPDNVTQLFNPGAANAGINVGSIAGDPSAPNNGDLWYDSTSNELTARINGVNVALGTGSGSGTVNSGTDKRIAFYSGTGTTVDDAAGFEYQAGASPNVSITAQNDAHVALTVIPASATPTVETIRIQNPANTFWIAIDPTRNSNTDYFTTVNSSTGSVRMSQGNTGSTTAVSSYGLFNNLGDELRMQMNNSATSNTNLVNIPRSVVFDTPFGLPGGIVFASTSGPIILGTGGSALTNERMRIDTSGGLTHQSGVRTSGVVPYFRIQTPADTGQTADTEFPGIFLGGSSTGTTVTRTGADGTTLALQREVIVPAPTYAFAGATTITDAATFAIVAAPIAGSNATLTNSYALLVQAGTSRFNGAVRFAKATSSVPVTLTDAATIATDASLGNRFRVSSAVDRTLGAPTNPTDGQQCVWRWKNTDSGAHTLTLASGAGGFRFGSTITALTATAAGKADYITAEYILADDRWDVLGYTKEF